jgi:hypothetical protein
MWVVEGGANGRPGRVAAFEGGYRAWRTAIAEGWSVASDLELQSRRLDGLSPAASAGRSATNGARAPRATGAGPNAAGESRPSAPARVLARPRQAPLSKDAYRRQKNLVEADLTRLGLRKSHLELALADPTAQSNFVELRRLTSELADVDRALSTAEDAWLALEDRAPR